MEYKAIKISKEVYDSLKKARDRLIKKLKKEGNLELWQQISSMGIGSFASWLIFKETKCYWRKNGKKGKI